MTGIDVMWALAIIMGAVLVLIISGGGPNDGTT